MIHLRPVPCLLLLVAFAPIRCAAQDSAATQPPPENAAVKYLRADASLRQSYPLAPDAAQTLQKALQAPLDDADEKLVAAADDALVEFDHGAALPFCNWDLSADGNTAHRGAITELVAVSGLRARLRFRDGNSSGAVSDVLASMAAERHLSLDGSLASLLFSYKMEQPGNSGCEPLPTVAGPAERISGRPAIVASRFDHGCGFRGREGAAK